MSHIMNIESLRAIASKPKEALVTYGQKTARFYSRIRSSFEAYCASLGAAISLLPGSPRTASDIFKRRAAPLNYNTLVAFIQFHAAGMEGKDDDAPHVSTVLKHFNALTVILARSTRVRLRRRLIWQVRTYIRTKLRQTLKLVVEDRPHHFVTLAGLLDLVTAAFSPSWEVKSTLDRWIFLAWFSVLCETGARIASLVVDLTAEQPICWKEVTWIVEPDARKDGANKITMKFRGRKGKTAESRYLPVELEQKPDHLAWLCPVRYLLVVAEIAGALPQNFSLADFNTPVTAKKVLNANPEAADRPVLATGNGDVGVTSSVLRRRMKVVASRAGFAKCPTPHTIRRSAAICLKKRGHTNEEVRRFLKHKHLTRVVAAYTGEVITADLTGTTFGGLDKTDLVHEEHPLALKRGAPAPEGFKATAKARTGLSLAARREAASNQDVVKAARAADNVREEVLVKYGVKSVKQLDQALPEVQDVHSAYRKYKNLLGRWHKYLRSVAREQAVSTTDLTSAATENKGDEYDEDHEGEDEEEALGQLDEDMFGEVDAGPQVPTADEEGQGEDIPEGDEVDFDAGEVQAFYANLPETIEEAQDLVAEAAAETEMDGAEEVADGDTGVEDLDNDEHAPTELSVPHAATALDHAALSLLGGSALHESVTALLAVPLQQELMFFRPGEAPIEGICPTCSQEHLTWPLPQDAQKREDALAKAHTAIATCHGWDARRRIINQLMDTYPPCFDQFSLFDKPKSGATEDQRVFTPVNTVKYIYNTVKNFHTGGVPACAACSEPFTSYAHVRVHALKHGYFIGKSALESAAESEELAEELAYGRWDEETALKIFGPAPYSTFDSQYHPDPVEFENHCEYVYGVAIVGSKWETYGVRDDITLPPGVLVHDRTGTADTKYQLVSTRFKGVLKGARCPLCVNNTRMPWSERMHEYSTNADATVHMIGCLKNTVAQWVRAKAYRNQGHEPWFTHLSYLDDGRPQSTSISCPDPHCSQNGRTYGTALEFVQHMCLVHMMPLKRPGKTSTLADIAPMTQDSFTAWLGAPLKLNNTPARKPI